MSSEDFLTIFVNCFGYAFQKCIYKYIALAKTWLCRGLYGVLMAATSIKMPSLNLYVIC